MVVRESWEAHGFQCRSVDNPLGTINGYVGLPKGHAYYNLSYDYFEVNVHGGITYASLGSDEPNKEGLILFPNPDLYWIGWGTLNSGDFAPYSSISGRNWSLSDVKEETTELARQLKMIAEGESAKRKPTNSESIELLQNLKNAIDDLEGVKIPFNIIKDHIEPLAKWLIRSLKK